MLKLSVGTLVEHSLLMQSLELRVFQSELLAQHLVRVLAELRRRTHGVRPRVRLERMPLLLFPVAAPRRRRRTRRRRRVPHSRRRNPQGTGNARIGARIRHYSARTGLPLAVTLAQLELERHPGEAHLLEHKCLAHVKHRPAGERRAREEPRPVVEWVASERASDMREQRSPIARPDALRVACETGVGCKRAPVGRRVLTGCGQQLAEVREVRVSHAANYIVAGIARPERLVRHNVRVRRSCAAITGTYGRTRMYEYQSIPSPQTVVVFKYEYKDIRFNNQYTYKT